MSDTFLDIDLDKIRQNVIKLKKKADTKFASVIKADAYGLGAVEIAKEIEDLSDYFAVARISEAKELRDNNIENKILTLGYVSLDDIEYCEDNDIEIAIYDLEFAKKINSIVKNKINCHLALDTGHSRIGFREYEIEKIKQLTKLKKLNFIGCFSHFATADEKETKYTKKQYEIFDFITSKIKDSFDFEIIHISNDAGFLKHDISLDMVRSGICIYGIYPSDIIKKENAIKLEQAFELYSTITFIKNIKKDVAISYGRKFISEKEMKIATINIGYADGYMRSFSNCGEVLINGHRCKVLGAVCMDQMMVDVTGIDVKIGQKVLIYPDIYKEAEKINTIAYELMTSISKRVERRYFKGNKLISIKKSQ
ncbi:MAG: alanine racemase [Tissierellia bacterium]|nr:alanine racemase [Tissierellia bacterium]